MIARLWSRVVRALTDWPLPPEPAGPCPYFGALADRKAADIAKAGRGRVVSDLYRNAAFNLAGELGDTIATASAALDAVTTERDEWRARAERAEAALANILAAHRRLVLVDGCEVWACGDCDTWEQNPEAPQCVTAAIILEAQAQTAHPDMYSCYCDSVCECDPAHTPANPHAEKVARIRRIRRMVDDLEWFADLQGWAKPYLWTRDARAEADRLERCPVTRTEANPKAGENT